MVDDVRFLKVAVSGALNCRCILRPGEYGRPIRRQHRRPSAPALHPRARSPAAESGRRVPRCCLTTAFVCCRLARKAPGDGRRPPLVGRARIRWLKGGTAVWEATVVAAPGPYHYKPFRHRRAQVADPRTRATTKRPPATPACSCGAGSDLTDLNGRTAHCLSVLDDSRLVPKRRMLSTSPGYARARPLSVSTTSAWVRRLGRSRCPASAAPGIILDN